MLIFSHSWAASLSRPHSQSWNNFEGSAALTLVFSHFMAPPSFDCGARSVLACIGDVYITFAGDQEVAEQAD